jgi:predicted phosphodiesterase
MRRPFPQHRPMRIALISDVHANLPALRAVLDDIGRRGVDAIYHLGDLVGYAPWPDETVAAIRDAGIAGIAGNYDSTVATGYAHCGCRYEDPRQEALAHESYAWTRARCSEATVRALAALPFRLDVRPLGGHRAGPRVVLVHGTPSPNTLYWTEDRPDAFCLKMAAHAGLQAGDVLAFGHTHLPWTREVDGIRFVNTGSVGRPKDGDRRAGYALLEVGELPATVEFARVTYDVEETARAIRASTLPDDFASYLETGGRPAAVGAG